MTERAPASPPPSFERSARRDFRIWLLLLFGIFFAWAGSTIDPATNCDESGDCAPWLVPIAKWMGIGALLVSLAQLWANPRRGSRFDAETGEFVWWQQRVGRAGGDMGRIDPSQIGRIVVIRESDNTDQVHLYDRAGQRQAYFDNEVIPWTHERWTAALKRAWPHIEIEIRG